MLHICIYCGDHCMHCTANCTFMHTMCIGIKVMKTIVHSRTVSKAELDALLIEHDSVAFDIGALIQCALLDNPLKLYLDEIVPKIGHRRENRS